MLLMLKLKKLTAVVALSTRWFTDIKYGRLYCHLVASHDLDESNIFSFRIIKVFVMVND